MQQSPSVIYWVELNIVGTQIFQLRLSNPILALLSDSWLALFGHTKLRVSQRPRQNWTGRGLGSSPKVTGQSHSALSTMYGFTLYPYSLRCLVFAGSRPRY